jgi:hypothetical protein
MVCTLKVFSRRRFHFKELNRNVSLTMKQVLLQSSTIQVQSNLDIACLDHFRNRKEGVS